MTMKMPDSPADFDRSGIPAYAAPSIDDSDLASEAKAAPSRRRLRAPSPHTVHHATRAGAWSVFLADALIYLVHHL